MQSRYNDIVNLSYNNRERKNETENRFEIMFHGHFIILSSISISIFVKLKRNKDGEIETRNYIYILRYNYNLYITCTRIKLEPFRSITTNK